MKEIPISKSDLTALVSDEDYEFTMNFKWFVSGKSHRPYLTTYIGRKRILLHNLICIKKERGQLVDHINRNTLDYRRENLRLVTELQNRWNRSTTKGRKHLGVAYVPARQLWRAQLNRAWKKKEGYFPTERLAAIARDLMVKEFGDRFNTHINITDPTQDEIAQVQEILSTPKRSWDAPKTRGIKRLPDGGFAAIVKTPHKMRTMRRNTLTEAAVIRNHFILSNNIDTKLTEVDVSPEEQTRIIAEFMNHPRSGGVQGGKHCKAVYS